jgi:hypothetical protein
MDIPGWKKTVPALHPPRAAFKIETRQLRARPPPERRHRMIVIGPAPVVERDKPAKARVGCRGGQPLVSAGYTASPRYQSSRRRAGLYNRTSRESAQELEIANGPWYSGGIGEEVVGVKHALVEIPLGIAVKPIAAGFRDVVDVGVSLVRVGS